MNILYVITGLGIGGAEMVTVNLANEMFKRGHRVSILYLTGANEVSDLIDSGITVIGGFMRRNPVSLLKMLIFANRYVSHFCPQVVHSHMFHANMFSRLLHLFTRSFVLITTEHSKNIEGKLRMFLYRITDRLSDMNTNVSKEATQYFIAMHAFSSMKSYFVYNGIDLNKFKKNEFARTNIRERYGISQKDFLFLNIGRLTEAKNQVSLINAFFYLSQKHENAKLIVVGEGPLRSELERLISELNLNKKVFLVGGQSDTSDFYSAADCFVLSSSWEGLPMAVIEAKAASLPVISTTASQEIVDPYYIVPTDAPDLLKEKMEMVFSMSADSLSEYGEKNRVESAIFDIETICNQWETYYKM